MATLRTPRQYRNVSLILKDVAKDAVFQALAKHLHPVEIRLTAQEKRVRDIPSDTILVHPFEILAIGGDDLFLIVPGNKALEIALAIGQIFEQHLAEDKHLIKLASKKLLSTKEIRGRYHSDTLLSDANYAPMIGLSAGVIVAQENAPIFFLRDLVEELLKSAKKLAKENASTKTKEELQKQPFYGGAVDFMVMKSITMVTDNIKSFRMQALGDDGKDSLRRLTVRPYTWHEFAGLLRTIRTLKKAHVPRSQLYRLRRALDADGGSSITTSVMEYLYTRARMLPAYGDALQEAIEQPWCWATPVKGRTGGLPPWMPLDKKGWETIWADLLEIYEMVPEQELP
jgi:CRISPR-associated protein Cmr2